MNVREKSAFYKRFCKISVLIRIFVYIITGLSFEYYTVKALEEIASTLGITKLSLSYGDPCDIKKAKD